MADPGASSQSPAARLWTLHIARESRGGVRIVAVGGRLGAASSPLLGAALTEELDGGCERMLIDFDRVDYVSSAGLRVIQDARVRAMKNGVRLALCNLSEPVRLAFDLAGVMDDFRIEASCDAGVMRLQRSGPDE